jgi:hypothetical protein
MFLLTMDAIHEAVAQAEAVAVKYDVPSGFAFVLDIDNGIPADRLEPVESRASLLKFARTSDGRIGRDPIGHSAYRVYLLRK